MSSLYQSYESQLLEERFYNNIELKLLMIGEWKPGTIFVQNYAISIVLSYTAMNKFFRNDDNYFWRCSNVGHEFEANICTITKKEEFIKSIKRVKDLLDGSRRPLVERTSISLSNASNTKNSVDDNIDAVTFDDDWLLHAHKLLASYFKTRPRSGYYDY